MAILASTALTLSEWATRLDPGGKPAAVIELLGQTNEMLTDMLWMECNDGAGHKTTVRTGLPNATWRLLYGGVQRSKSTTAQARDSTAPINAEFRGKVDNVPVSLSGNLGPLDTLVKRQAPYPVSIEGEVAGRKTNVVTKMVVTEGSTRLDDLAALKAALSARGFKVQEGGGALRISR